MEKQPEEFDNHPLRDLCSTLTPQELDQAEDNLREYVALAIRVYERIRSDKTAYDRFRALTGLDKDDTIHSQEQALPDDSSPLS